MNTKFASLYCKILFTKIHVKGAVRNIVQRVETIGLWKCLKKPFFKHPEPWEYYSIPASRLPDPPSWK